MRNLNHYHALYYPAFEPDITWLKSHLILVDEISRIIPADAEHEDSDAIKVLKNLMPGVISEYHPSREDITVDDLNLRRLETAFKIIRDEGGHVDNRNIHLNTDGSLEFPGRVMLHDQKLCHEVRHLLGEYGLIDRPLPDVARAIGAKGVKDYWVTNRQASDLVLSCLADKIARRNGLDTITDQHLAFSLTSLEGLGIRSSPTLSTVDGSLLSAVASVSIPLGIQHLAPEKYKEVRDSFAEIRAAFQLLVRELVISNQLDQIEDETALRERIEQIASAFNAEVVKYRQTHFAKQFRAWAPTYVSGLLTVTGTLVSPPVGLVLAAASVVVNVIDKKINASASPTTTQRCCRMVGDLTETVMKMHKYYPRLLL